jgi:hypothetical protein
MQIINRLTSAVVAFLLFITMPVWLPILIVVMLLTAVYKLLYRGWLTYRFSREYGEKGKVLVLVYSRSPNWQEYIETNWIPKLSKLAVIVDYSDRSKWGTKPPIEVRIAREWGGDKEYNPMAIVLRGKSFPRMIRFYKPFLDYKHGKVELLKTAEQKLFSLITNSLGKTD